MNQVLSTNSFGLSPMQQGMLFHYLKEPHSGVDIEQLVIHLPQAIDGRRLEEAWRWLVQRHDILRTRFIWESVEEPQQEVLPEVEVPFALREARQLPKRDQDDLLKSFLETDRLLGFELDRAPLLRLTLFQWTETSFSLVWTLHHALLDGRSYPVLLREVFEVYDELAQGAVSQRPIPYSYRRHIDWLNEQNFDASESFWRNLLSGFSAPTPLVVDRQAPAAKGTYQQGEAWQILDSATTQRLRILTETNGLTVNSLVMGCWAILFHRYSGEEDIVFGATRACRKSSNADANETIGLFINTVPVRVRLTGDDSPLSVFHNIRRQWLDMRPYEHTPLTRVKATSAVPRNQPLFETLLVFENYRLDTTMRSLGGDWTKRQVELHELTNFPITLAVYNGDELSFKIEFDRRRLEDAAVHRLLGHLCHLLKGVAADPQSAVRALPMMGEAERRELIEEFNLPATPPSCRSLPLDGGATLHCLFEDQVKRRPQSVALTCDGRALTYAELNSQANRLARKLVQFGIKANTLVGLCLERSIELVVALLAILKAGGAYLPIDLAYPADRLAFMLEDAHAPVLLTQRKLTDDLPPTKARVICVEDVFAEAIRPGDEDNLPAVATPNDLAYVIYTSGTTGKPKGSLITNRNVARLFSATDHWYGFNEHDVWTLFHSSAFDFSVWEIWGALIYGGRLVVVPFIVSRSPEAFYELLGHEQVTVLNQTPSAFRQLIQAEESIGKRDLALRFVIFGGEALEMQSLRPWFDRHGDKKPQLVNMYGITETTVHVTYRPISKDDLASGSVIGVPIPDLQIYILDDQGQPVPVGVPGEMYVGGAGLARGYLHREELTAKRFIPDHLTGRKGSRLYKTGDLARLLPDRDIEYLGRIDDQVKIRGFRIELGEIESVLGEHPMVREASVMAREDVPGAKRLVAYLVTQQPAPELSELRDHLTKKMPEYMVPSAFVFLEKLPLTNNGKIDRKALPVPEQQRPPLAERFVPPRTEAEKKLAAIWSKVLRVAQVGVNDNFFELGGDSILCIQIISLARSEKIKLTPSLLFEHQTISELAAVAEPGADLQPLRDLPVGNVSLSPIQKWFFEQNLDDMQHYNQALLLKVAEPMDQGLLERALQQVSRQHDALRLRYVSSPEGWSQFYLPSEEPVPLLWVELSDLPEVEQYNRLESIASQTQTTLNLESGPLWRVVYFNFGSDRPSRLLFAIHHLAVDGVSWRPILEDLETAYKGLNAGQVLPLPAKTSSFKLWAERLAGFANSKALREELPYWQGITNPKRIPESAKLLAFHKGRARNTEGAARTLAQSLTASETQALLQQVPAAYNTQINDVLLTALARAWECWTGSNFLFTNLEGHGRENIYEDVDVSRTVGWFTSIFPVGLELPRTENQWLPGEALKSVKEQLRRIPRRGIGYGILRYMRPESEFAAQPEPPMVFNYLGQFDQIVAGLSLFQLARESAGPWHSPRQRRRHILEINAVVIDGRLEVVWTYHADLHSETGIPQFANEFLAALKELIIHAQTSHGRTPSDFPLAGLDQSNLDRLLSGRRDAEDIYRLSPIQTLFFSAHAGSSYSAFDQWHCTLGGELDVSAFRQAWQATLQRHTILRSTIHSDGLREPVQIVHQDVRPHWTIEDWRSVSPDLHGDRWSNFLKKDRSKPLVLTDAPVMRFALIRLANDSWKFLWTVPALLLDGWSWPVVFRDVSHLYEAFTQNLAPGLEPVRPYRDYLEWVRRPSVEQAQEFWRKNLIGFREPTLLPGDFPDAEWTGERFIDHEVLLSAETSQSLEITARRLQVTLNTIVQGAWALLLSRQNRASEVVFGAAFSGRPTDLHGVESIVGPFVNNLPVRVKVNQDYKTDQFFKQLHAQLLGMNPFQFTPLMEIQRVSEVPWRCRLFDSVIVFQNYLVDESARRFGGRITIEDFAGPIHTNYPLMLLAEPESNLRLKLIYDSRTVARSTVGRWARDIATLLERVPFSLERRIEELQALLSEPMVSGTRSRLRLRAQSQNFVPPQTGLEDKIVREWQKMFGLERISVEDNFFELGGHSLLLIQMHALLGETLNIDFPIVTLLEHPTVRSLASHLSQPVTGESEAGEKWRARASRQKQALGQLRNTLRKRSNP
jgi:amino acid adenylation domain-containing protein/non-ribosomal peptide synthase protein (TIGR01720 family)